MKVRWPAVAAALLTALLIWAAGRATVVTAVVPLVLPGLWLAVWLLVRRPGVVIALAAVGVVAGAFGMPATPALILSAYVAAGLAGGAASARGCGTLVTVLLVAAFMVPGLVLALHEVPMAKQLEEMASIARASFKPPVAAGDGEAHRTAMTAEFERQLAATMTALQRVWPSLMALGLLLQAATGLALGRLLARAGGWRTGRAPGRPFASWEAPGVVVWILAAGLAAVLLGGTAPDSGVLRLAGLNAIILAALALALQGLAVQVWVSLRYMTPVGRTVYWLLTAFFLAPVVAVVGAVLGLMDQWWDLRKLHRGPEQAEEGGSPWK